MLRSVFIFPTGLVAAFDQDGQQVAEQQGQIVWLHYKNLRAQGLVNDESTFTFIDANGDKQEKTGAQMERYYDVEEGAGRT